LQKADIGEFLAEFLRFIMFTGFFWWLLLNGPNYAVSIMDSMRQLGGQATGLNTALSPSNIVDVGFAIFDRVVDKSSFWTPADSIAGIIIAVIVLIILALVAVNMLILLISGWILAYAGVFFLGFGGSKWTSEMAINYFKTVLNIAAQLLAMVVIVGIGNAILITYYNSLSADATIKELAVEVVVAVVLFALVNKIPGLIGGLASGGGAHALGSGFSGSSIGRGAQTAGAGVTTAAGAIGMAGAVATAGAIGAAGGASALYAAIKQGSSNTAAGTDIAASIGSSLASMGGAAQDFLSGGGGSGSGTSNSTGRSLAEQMGMGMQGGAPAFAASGGGSSGSGGSSTGARGADQSSRQGDTGAAVGAGVAGGGGAGRDGDRTGAGGPGDSKDAKGGGGGAPNGQAQSQGEGNGAGKAPATGGAATDKRQRGGEDTGGSLLGALTSGGRIAADAAANLGVGVYDFGMEKAGDAIAAAQERIGQTWGGQVASAIRKRGARSEEADEATFDGDTLTAAALRDTTVDADAEIAAFRDRNS